MTKIDIFSGFLGAGKTTLIKKLITEAYRGEKLVLIENEFGEIGIDGGFLADAGIVVNEMNSGCICCSLVGDFGQALQKVLAEYNPDRILIERSGVGKLSDVVKAVRGIHADLEISGLVTVADAKKCRMYLKNFGEFFGDQIEHAGTVVLSHVKGLSHEQVEKTVEALRALNEKAVIVTTDWDLLTGEQLLFAISGKDTLDAALSDLKHGHHHHHHHDEECDCHEHHHHDEECHCHEHHHHDEECHCHEHHHHDEECHCHEHHHHDEECHCHEHHHHDEECHCHGHHHADEVFVSCGAETTKQFGKEDLAHALAALEDTEKFGTVLRAKGIVAGEGTSWLHFDYVPGEPDVREGSPSIIGRLCVIGADLNVPALSALLGVELK